MPQKINLAIFASGSGTNAENIVRSFQNHERIAVKKILSNKSDAGVHKRAAALEVPSFTFTKEAFHNESFLAQLADVDYIILAGFLWLVPSYLVRAFPDRIINIHPSLLPKYGGKGMYGDRVHRAVIAAGEKESGITIHLVNEAYDEGKILSQAKCDVLPKETPETLAQKIHTLEYDYFPKVIEDYVLKHPK